MVKGYEERGRKFERGKSVERGRSKSKAGFELKCYRCHEPGHFKKNYPQKGKGGNWKKKQGKAGDRKDGPSNSANVVEQDDSEDGDMLSVSANPDHLADSWILDSACSYHMSPNREWFDTYRHIKGYRNPSQGKVASSRVYRLSWVILTQVATQI
ncbi:hypothetical protein Vadar_007498 [Vaccinium darrowii]|uniref:Uncharacterized protein n=1 Tax=Vaccinium darrowii TaxID=229202 RepID=A0ACB7XXU3_9ERIC|nr:hypothetical protein Vadar_007498 [Vaccinium darrowii]